MNNIKKYKKILITVLIAVLLTLPFLSKMVVSADWVGGVELAIKSIADPATTTGLAWFIANHTDLYMNAKIDEIYALNRKNNNTGLEAAEVMGTHDIYYNTAMCLHHASGSNKDGYKVKLSNIIEIESPGIITIYKWTGTVGDPKISYDSFKVDLTDEKAAKDFWVNKMKQPSSTFNHEKMKEDILAFAYLDYKSTQSREYDDRIGIYGIENSMYHLWGETVRDYIKATGKLDKEYEQKLDVAAAQEKDKDIAEARTAVANSMEPLSLTKNDTAPTIEYVNGKAYIGPLKATFSGGTPKVTVGGTEAKWVAKNSNGSYGSEQSGSALTSGQVFYAVISENNIKDNNSVNVKVELSADKYKSRVILSTNKSTGGQELMFHAGVKETDSTNISWDVEQSKKVSIQKQDANGNALKTVGIKFEIYDANGTKVGTLKTNADGKTNTVNLKPNMEYTLKETKNNAYGYKNASISGATIKQGGKIISSSNGEIKFSISADTTIEVKNTPELGNLTVHKTGNDGKDLEGVQFVLWKGNAYLKLDEDSVKNPIVTTDEGLDITKYNFTYVDSRDKATKFKTNASGKIVINNLEIYLGKGIKYEYSLVEIENSNYGYKAMKIQDDKVTVTGGKKIKVDAPTSSTYGAVKFDITNKTTVEIANIPELSTLELQKVGEDNKGLENVKFIIQRDAKEYLQLKDSDGKVVTSIKGLATINANNIATSSEYSVVFVTNKDEATNFITDSDGKITIKNIEVNKTRAEKYSYTAYEVGNDNYGYGSGKNIGLSSTITNLTPDKTVQVKITNKKDLGNLKLEKYDEDNKNIKLENVGFAIEITPAPSKSYAYLALYNKEGKIVSSVKGEATVNKQNEANDTEYKVSYYCTDKKISEMTESEKANITTFITDSKGTLTVNNLEVYEAEQGKKYTYKLIETTNSNYGYVADSVELGNITLETGSTTNKELGNKQKYTKLSGYVWIENSLGKSNQYDLVYTEGDSSNDIKLKDLYITENGKLIKNNNAKIPVEVILRDRTTGNTVKALPDEFDGNGKYTFVDIEIDKISNYEVVFVYNGFYYTTVVSNLDQNNGSKVKEITSERESLNNKFATIKNNNEIVSTNGTVNTVEYNKQGHTSTVSKLNFDTTLSATTAAANYNLKEAFDKAKANSTTAMQELENVNMGMVLREQPKLSVNDDIYSVLVGFEGYQYNYEYNGRDKFYENKNGDDIGVKFEQENVQRRYTRTVFASDVQAAKDQNKEIKVAVTYKIRIANESRTLSVMPKELINYFDARYDVKAVGLGFNTTTHTITDELKFSEAKAVNGHPEYKSTIIEFNQIITASNSNTKDLYITFDVHRDAILDLLNQKSTYHNAVEILSYSSLYGTETSKVDGKQFTTDQTESGKLYAGIDKMSQPGNMEIALVDHSSGDGTKILDTTNFEDDTSSAPSLLLEATSSREISGTIWEDTATNTSDNQRLGDGIYDEANEKPIQNVTVELRKLNEDGSIGEVATYSNGEKVSTVTNESGNYTFGYYDEDNKKYVGVLPGKYVIAYTYNNSSYIVGGKSINPNEYKSTIITSQNIIDAFNGTNQRWYAVEEHRYSDARDDVYLRPEYNSNVDANITVTNSTYNNVLSIDNMKAYTPIMDIGIEFTVNDEASGMIELHKKLNNIDFGIIERPNVNVIIDKKITGLEVIAQNGTNIIPKGNPSNPGETMQYVKTGLDGLVSAEIEPKLLQGAQLNLEYTITVSNNSNKDYLETDYYYYGKNGKTEITPKVRKVVDYLDSTMALDTTKNGAIWEEKTADDLYNTETKEGLVSEEVYNELKSGNYHILVSEVFEDVGSGNQKSITLYATKVLSSTDSINEDNRVEIIELTGKRTVKESIPGDYNPTNVPDEQDSDKVKIQITQPTGTTVNYIVYIISVVATFAILVSGIVIIKKKVVKK